jgi:hypothetical protein
VTVEVGFVLVAGLVLVLAGLRERRRWRGK